MNSQIRAKFKMFIIYMIHQENDPALFKQLRKIVQLSKIIL